MLGTQFLLGKRQSISEFLLKVSWMVHVCQAVATCASRSQWQKSSSVLANSFLHRRLLLPTLGIQGWRRKQSRGRTEGSITSCLPCWGSQAWRAVDRVGLCWWMLCPAVCELYRIPPSCLAITAVIACCVYEWDSQTHQRRNLPADLWDRLPCFSRNPNDRSRDCTDF